MEQLYKHLKKTATSDIDFEEFCIKTTVIEAKKSTRLLSVGQHQDHLYYIKEGVVRSYSIDNSKEWTNFFFGKGDFAISVESFVFETASLDYLETCTPTTFISIKKVDYLKFFEHSSQSHISPDSIVKRLLKTGRERLWDLSNSSGYERYKKFRERYSHINDYINRNHLASFLGMSNECLSRLERKYVDEKYYALSK